VMEIMGRDPIPEADVGRAVHLLERIVEIQRLLIGQIDVLETMTPLDFLDFRDELVPASGFQSVQMRLIENVLGVDPEHRLRLEGDPYVARLAEDHAAIVRAAEAGPTLLDHLDRWLARTPFLHFGAFDFWEAYRTAVTRMVARERRLIETNPTIVHYTGPVKPWHGGSLHPFESDYWFYRQQTHYANRRQLIRSKLLIPVRFVRYYMLAILRALPFGEIPIEIVRKMTESVGLARRLLSGASTRN
jgi:hypothetical protein